MVESLVLDSNFEVHYLLTRNEIGKRKFYTTIPEDKLIHAVIIDKVVIELEGMVTDVFNECVISGKEISFGVKKFHCRIATKEGIKYVELTDEDVKNFYDTPKMAADGNKNMAVQISSVKWKIGLIIEEALKNSLRGYCIIARHENGNSSFGYYAWDGMKPVFKYIDLEGCKTVSLGSDGWRFDDEPKFDDIDWNNAYGSEEACRQANSIEICDFSF
jgi:hypothetical protein